MSRAGDITLPWGDRERTFRLGIGQWRTIQEKCDAGPEEIAARLALTVQAMRTKVGMAAAAANGLVGRWRVDDVREVLYQGLLGGEDGLGAIEAAKLMRDLVDDRPLRENVYIAYVVVMASLDGVKDDPVGEPKGEAPAPVSPEGSTSSETSTAGVADQA